MPMIASFMVVVAEQHSCGPDYTGARGRDIVLGWSYVEHVCSKLRVEEGVRDGAYFK
jgi:hypothetical protein